MGGEGRGSASRLSRRLLKAGRAVACARECESEFHVRPRQVYSSVGRHGGPVTYLSSPLRCSGAACVFTGSLGVTWTAGGSTAGLIASGRRRVRAHPVDGKPAPCAGELPGARSAQNSPRRTCEEPAAPACSFAGADPTVPTGGNPTAGSLVTDGVTTRPTTGCRAVVMQTQGTATCDRAGLGVVWTPRWQICQ